MTNNLINPAMTFQIYIGLNLLGCELDGPISGYIAQVAKAKRGSEGGKNKRK